MRHFVLNIITEKMIMLVLATVFIQLMFTVDSSSQYEFSNQNEPLNKETMMMNDRVFIYLFFLIFINFFVC